MSREPEALLPRRRFTPPMAAEAILRRLEAEFDTPPEHIRAVVDLHAAGCTPAFIALFRRGESGNIAESRVIELCERYAHLDELDQRKSAIGEKIAHAQASDLAEVDLADCYDREFLDDIDHSLRPHEQTERARVTELGLTELLDKLHAHELDTPSAQEFAARHVDEARGLKDADAVLEVVVRALSERYGEDPLLRRKVRDELSRGILSASAKAPGKGGPKKGAKRYAEFFDFQEPVRRIAANRMLALRKAEREGIVRVRLDLPQGRELELYRERFSSDIPPDTPVGQLLDLVYQHSYRHHMHDPCDFTVRHELKESADRETVNQFARSLRAQLMGPGLGPNAALAVRASGKALWIASTKEDGSLGPRHTLGLAEPSHHEEAAKVLAETIREVSPKAIAIPHGRGHGAARKHLDAAYSATAELPRAPIVAIDETASMVYASSATAKRKMPGTDTGMRATISLVRRLLDPLRELTRIEPRGLGLGNNMNEVHQGLLTRTLEALASSCIAHVGVDANRADTDFLAHVPGLSRDQARAIVEHRTKNAPFRTLEELRGLEAIDDNTFQQVAGFLRIHGGEEPLDATSIHPEDYDIARAIAASKSAEVSELLGQPNRDVELTPLCESLDRPRARILDVLKTLSQHGTHGGGTGIESFNNFGVATFDDLKQDLQLRGRVTNLTEFGAFVDLGIGTDGLVHVSQIPENRMRQPENCLKVGEVIDVFVVSTDEKTKRIGLSMRPPRPNSEGRRSGGGGDRAQGGRGGGGRGRGGQDRRDGQEGGGRRDERGRRGQRGQKREGGGGGFGGGGGGFGRGRRDDRGRRGDRTPRVHTIEASREVEESRGHKGELRSLAGLKGLLGGGDAQPSSEKSES